MDTSFNLNPSINRRRLLSGGILLFITLLGAALRLHHAQLRLLWLDEIHTFHVVNEPQSFLLMLKTWWSSFQVSDPPLFYIFNYAVSGGNPWAPHIVLRAVSLAWGVAAIPVTWAVYRLIASDRTALIGAFLMATNVFAIQYSQEYRPYSQLLCLGLVYGHAQILIIVRGFSWKRWVWLLVASAGLILTHYFGGFALAGGYMVWCGCEIWRRTFGRPGDVEPFRSRNGNEHRRYRWRPLFTGIICLPLALGILYIPVIEYGIGQTRHFSGLAGRSAAGKAMESAFVAQKAYLSYWTNLPYVFETWYLGSMSLAGTVFMSLLAVAGGVILLGNRPRQFTAVASYTLITLLFGYAFYQAMHYPYEPRRSIYQLPLFIYLVAVAITAPFDWFCRTAKPEESETAQINMRGRAFRKGDIMATIMSGTLLAAVATISFINYFRYDSYGYRIQANVADWKGMAEFIQKTSRPDDVIGLPAEPGNSWFMSQFNFYRKRTRLHMPVIPVNTTEDVARIFRSGAKGLWYIDTLPSHIDDQLCHDLLNNGQWQAFVGGAVVYMDRPTTGLDAVGGQHDHALLVRENGDYVLMPINAPSDFQSRVRVAKPREITLLFDHDHPFNTMMLPKGLLEFADEMTASPCMTSWTLAEKIPLSTWRRTTDFHSWQPGSQVVGFPVVDGLPAPMMQYNGKIKYWFFLDKAGYYNLTLEAKNDAPGPIMVNVSVAGTSNMPPFEFGRGDNSISQVTHGTTLHAGLNEMTFDYTSFKRIKNRRWLDVDTFNQCVITRWRIDHSVKMDVK